MLRQSLLWASRADWLARRLPRYPFMRRAVRRFMPGEDVEDALAEAGRLEREGITSLLTLLGENVTDEEEARVVARHYEDVLARAVERGLDLQVSVKLTQLGLDLGREVALENLRRVVARGRRAGRPVWVDMESSEYTDVTLDLYRRVREEGEGVGVCLQAYLYRTAQDLESLLPLGPSIRLVKGAYREPKEVAHPRRKDVDAAYMRLSRRLLEAAGDGGGAFAAFGTHDMGLIGQIREEAEAQGVSRDVYEFEMLYGIGRRDQLRLARDECRMRVLISYGPSWFPWYMRRLAERPANLWFVARSLLAR